MYRRERKGPKLALGGLSSDGIMLFKHNGLGVDSHTLGGVVGFVDADETISDLKHVVPQGDDDELSVLCLLLHRDEKRNRND